MNDRAEILQHLQQDPKFLLTTHENPDGDAVGSLVGMNLILEALGKDTLMFVRAADFPLPHDCRRLLAQGEATHAVPEDLSERTVIYLDCGSFERMNEEALRNGGRTLLNIDHHHDNPGFGMLNLVEPERSSTAELVYSLAVDLGLAISPALADALYVGLVTDTNRFMYQNTGPEAHEMAADLVRSGVDVYATFKRIYEDQPAAKVRLLARALSNLQLYDDGALAIVNLSASDFEQTGAEETHTEGIVDHARSIEGTVVGALYRELAQREDDRIAKISLRSSDDRVDVSAIARVLGGGGHRQAAGATTEKDLDEAVELIRTEISRQLTGKSPARAS